MYNILIAEDEAIERNVVRYLINQNNFDLHVYEAENGKAAFNLLQRTHIDILLTDVQMPLMNGLELAEKTRQIYPDIPVIFFSGHDDFSYVKQALTLHAVNYIMKPVDPDEFQTTISKVLSDLLTQSSLLLEKQCRLHIIQNHILYKLINKTSLKHLNNLYPQIDFSFIYNCHRLILIQMNQDYFDIIPAEDDIYFSSEELRQLIPSGSHFINLNPAQNVVLLTGSEHTPAWYKNLANKLSDYIQKVCHITCHIAISKYISSPEELSSAYEEAEMELSESFFLNTHSPLSSEEHIDISDMGDIILSLLQADIQFGDSSSLRSHITQLFEGLKHSSDCSQLYFRFLCTSILKILLDSLLEKENLFDNYAAIITRSVHLAPIETLLLHLTDKLSRSFQNESDSPLQALRQVKQYIHKHYAEDISLEILAKKVFLTPNYLSKLFIEHNGYGINKYVKKIRMEKAQELLLNTNLSVNDISKQVGYSSNSYFCKSFLKDFEISPEKFRNENRALERIDD